ncbi:hypothetical protein M3P36_00985 [Altererythrobacter sp. KTW20L]|uniref:hypothetical protein n=1 Tax=Altererythrobacter sp. KTW20L TaxID=2942210 RepID=UPI0020BDF759|nr:hypothetical protein [Altererythrobacter sp. KTW20L]MCL6249625.1 hypothetical protein [Altererythrobacter sp. KTW20L]
MILRFSSSASLSALAIGLIAAQPALLQAQSNAPVTSQVPEGAASAEAAGDSFDDADTIVVLGARLIGQVQAAQPPILELTEADIAAYGAGSIADLIQALGPQVTSARGRGGGGPVILVNGVRIGSFRELRSYPPEAIEKFEVFAEEVALEYGYSADQRVINVILKRNFSSREVELEYGQPWSGGFSSQEVEATYLMIAGASRLNINLGWENASPLTEADRNIIQTGGVSNVPGDPDPAAFRSLTADTAGLEGTVNWSTTVGGQHSLALNTTYERSDSLRLQGLDTVLLTGPAPTRETALRVFNEGNPLAVDNRTQTLAAAATLNLSLGGWEATTTLDANRTRSNSRIERRLTAQNSPEYADLIDAAAAGTFDLDDPIPAFGDPGVDQALTRTTSASGLSTLRGSPFYLPAGDVRLTFDAGYNWNRIESEDTRNPGPMTVLTRGNLSGGVNVSVPITSVRDDFLSAVGDITLNASAGVDHLSDFGTLYDWTLGLTWGVTDALTFSANYVNRDAAPSLGQLGNPEIATFNVPVFDLTNNETVLATVISGGNPLLPAQTQSDWKLGVQWNLPFLDNASVSLDYLRNSSEDVASGFPVLTPAIEAAFPGRVTRDTDGRLIQIDQRPVTYASREEERLQFGINLSGQIGQQAEQGGNGGGGNGGPVGGAVGGFGGGGFGGGGQGGGAPGGFQPNPEAFAQMRATFCEADPDGLRTQLNRAIAAAAAGEAPPVGEDGQPLAIPPQMLERLAGDDGVIDATEFETMRSRICSAGQPGAAGGQQGGPQGGPPGGFAGGPPPGGFGGGGRPPGGGGGGGGFGGGGMPFGGGGQGGSSGRWFVNLQYNLALQDEVLIAPGLPVLDLLDGDALSGGGGTKHGGSLRVGTFYNGFGMIWNARYTGNSTINGSGLPGSTDLKFNDYVTINVRAFADLGQRASLVSAVPFFEGSRIGFNVDNIFDTRQRVTDSAGLVPLRYQPFLIDPVGRSFEIEFRKLF